MFSKKEKPLPAAIVTPQKKAAPIPTNQDGIMLGSGVYWNPLKLPNPHCVIIGTSGSGKSQTLLAIAHSLQQWIPNIKIIIADPHGDLTLPGEKCYELDQESRVGINPLVVDLDTKGGGSALQAIAVAGTLKRALLLGVIQEGTLIDVLNECYSSVGIKQDEPQTWTKQPPTFAHLEKIMGERAESGDKECSRLLIKFAATFRYGIFTRPQPDLNQPLIRFNLSALGKVPGLGTIAIEAIAKQLMDSHRLAGAQPETLKTILIVDEARHVKKSPSVGTILRDGRKFGLGCCLASQMIDDIDTEVIANSAMKLLLAVDQADVGKAAKRLNFASGIVTQLEKFEGLLRQGKDAQRVTIIPFYQRVDGG